MGQILRSNLHRSGRRKKMTQSQNIAIPQRQIANLSLYFLERHSLTKEEKVKSIVSVICLATICIFVCPAFAADQGTFMIVPISCNKTTGNAVASDVLAGKTFSNQYAVGVTGTLPNVGKQVITPTIFNQTITRGYHDGSGLVVGDSDLRNIYIVKNKDIYGVKGSLGVFWGCRTGTDSWNSTACGIDCIQFSGLGAVGCANLCNGIYNLIAASLPYNIGGFICGGNGGL